MSFDDRDAVAKAINNRLRTPANEQRMLAKDARVSGAIVNERVLNKVQRRPGPILERLS